MAGFSDTKGKQRGGGRPSGGFQRSSSPGGRARSGGKSEERRARRAEAKSIELEPATDWLLDSMMSLQDYAWLHFLLFGPTGVGKSIAAASMPRALVLACDRHANWAFRDDERERVEKLFPNTAIQFRAVRIRNFHDMWAAYKVMEHGCVTGQWPLDKPMWSWVIDGATELQQVGADKVLDDMKHDAPDTHDYTLMKQDIRSLMLDLMKLPMHGLITCGEKNANTVENPMWIPAFMGGLAEELPTHMDIVGRIGMTDEGGRAVCVKPGTNHWAKDLTGRLGTWMGQNMQNWLHKAQGPDWRIRAKETREIRRQLAPKPAESPDAAPDPAAPGATVIPGAAPDGAEPLNVALGETPPEAAEGKEVAEVQGEQAGAGAIIADTGGPRPAAPQASDVVPGSPTGGCRPPAGATGMGESQDAPGTSPAPPTGVPDAPLFTGGMDAGGGMQRLAVQGPAPAQQEAAPPPAHPGMPAGNRWQPGMRCMYGADGQPPTRTGMVMEVDGDMVRVQHHDIATGKVSGRPVIRRWNALATVPVRT